MEVHIHLSRAWAKAGSVNVRGSAFYSGACLSSERLAQVFVGLGSAAEVAHRMQVLNGFFSVVIQLPTSVVAGVDRVRSIPLFYTIRGNRFYLSDDPRWIYQEAPLRDWDRCSWVEFLLTGYVTGPHTLVEGLRQVQAGELIWVDLRAGTVHSERYYKFLPVAKRDEDMDSLLERLHTVAREVIARLTSIAAGRPVVIPLSGGLDSRLIALHLKLAGYEPVYAFTYGRPGNAEAEISRDVAQQLGMEWKFVPYSLERWKAWYRCREYRAYVRAADGLASVAHVQDWPAVWELLSRGDVPDHAIFVPGHSADFAAGSHIPFELLRPRAGTREAVMEAVWKHHYCLSSLERAAKTAGASASAADNCLRRRIQSVLGEIMVSSTEDAVGAYEYWDWQERQAKFIVNSVRVYDFWEQAWWLPWWDAEFIAFWQLVPLRYRIRKQLYDRYVEQVQRRLKVSAPVPGRTSARLVNRFKGVVRSLPFADQLLPLRRQLVDSWRRRALLQEYYHHPLAWYGITEPGRFSEALRSGGNINTILAIDQLAVLEREAGRRVTPSEDEVGAP